jgi:hypothetical protein
MKTTALFLTVIFIAIGIMAFTFDGDKNNYSVLYASGPPAGYSGDPANDLRDCSSCHSGPEVQSQTGWITSNIPTEGYLPGSTYTITATAKGTGHTKFGFQVSPQDTLGNFLGTLVNTGSNTKLTSDPNYITQSAAGATGSDSVSWTFDWTAPAEGSGETNFYGAFNIANGDGRTSGDTIMVSILSIKEFITSIPDISAGGLKVSLYPNPASDFVTIDADNSILGSSYYIIDQAGKQVLKGKISSTITQVDIRQLEKGMYFIQVGSQARKSFKVIKY